MVQFAKIIHRWSPPIYWSPPTWEPKRRNDLFQQLSLKYSCPQIRGFESGIIYIRIYYSCNDISIHRHHRQMAFQPCPISNSLGEGCGLGASSRNLIGNHYPMWPVFFHRCLGGGFKYFLISSLFGEDSQFDESFSKRLKPPIRCVFNIGLCFSPGNSSGKWIFFCWESPIRNK